MSIRSVVLFVAAAFLLSGLISQDSFAIQPKSELIKQKGLRRDKKDLDPEIHLRNGIVLEAKSNGHLEAEKGRKDLGDRFIVLPNKKGTHDVYVISGRKFVSIMKNIFARRDKGDGDWEILLSRKWNLWFEIDTDCESREFLMGELETGSGKDIDLNKVFGRR